MFLPTFVSKSYLKLALLPMHPAATLLVIITASEEQKSMLLLLFIRQYKYNLQCMTFACPKTQMEVLVLM